MPDLPRGAGRFEHWVERRRGYTGGPASGRPRRRARAGGRQGCVAGSPCGRRPPGFHVTEDGLQEAILEAVAGIVGDAYERYRSLATLPDLIRWAADPNRRTDLFDARGEQAPASQTIRGYAGAAGVVEGLARVIPTADEGDRLRPGEILVTTVTNVGWTPLFPRAGAVVTD